MIRKRLLDIEAMALNILNKAAITKPFVDVKYIASLYSIEVKFHAFTDDISGVLVEKNNTFTIGVNVSHYENRQRFTIAHELGHYFLKHQRQGIFVDESPIKQNLMLFRDSFSSTGENSQEREANAFAAALLMPKPFIEHYIKNSNIDFTNDKVLEDMASEFKVSTGSMAFRLSNLGIFK